MTPQQYLELFRERWMVVVAGLLLGILVALGVVVAGPTVYPSSVTMVVSSRSSPDLATAIEGDQLSTQRMQTYIQLLTSTRLLGEVASDLQLGVTGDELAERVTASAEPETILLTATVTDPAPARAAEIANALAARFVQDVAEVEQPADPTLDPLVTVKVYEPAVPSTDPASPRPALTVALGAVIGLIVGVGAAATRQWFDTRVRTRRRLGEVLRAPVLGELSVARAAESEPLLMLADSRGPRAEEFRRLRTNLQHVVLDRGHKVIMVTSPSIGDGKTTVACNLACALAGAGRRVLVVETDLRCPHAADLFRVEAGVGLTDVLAGRARLGGVVRRWSEGVDGVASGPLPTHPGEMLGSPSLRRMLADARARYDVVLVDASPMLAVADAAVVAAHVDGVLLVVRHGTAARSVEETKDSLDIVSGRLLGTVLTMSPARRGHAGDTGVMPEREPSPRPAGPARPTAEPAPVPVPAPRPAVVAMPARQEPGSPGEASPPEAPRETASPDEPDDGPHDAAPRTTVPERGTADM
ncbi:polysaccharide biosynthesis tyrosine autokinase [Pseudonocardia sp. KRD291]|uniref:polysaccharide biosynthesis tyrosine autokinase n=1 Tax=Pseudonocardia sp. KRD291 TaxID=2792007 RepID=UPI001C4A648F|nr:polysaccharide biosynthesis tyrosine autokinase [Pseudonocardia sp. KRD291]MBW0101560.1 polysaccharide biosynthesis tyrosine autokinase [Pseudonocardia sp. KRD291]